MSQAELTTGHTAAALPALNADIAALPPYNAGLSLAEAQRLGGREDMARLASNENPDGCAPAVLAALSGAALEPWRYADPACTQLRAALAGHTGVAADRIVIGNGSEEMILAASRVLVGPGRGVLTVLPSFGLHAICAASLGAGVSHVPMTPGGGFDVGGLCAALAQGPAMLALSSPWNPVGPALDAPALDRLLRAADPARTAILFDEAYFEYADPVTRPDALAMLARWGGHWVSLRSFSKAWGLAGLRVGYALCSGRALATTLGNAKTPFNVNAAAQAGALAALTDPAWMQASVARCAAERARMTSALAAIGLFTPPSQTNFLFVDTGRDAEAVAAALLRAGVIVKPWREPGFEHFLRVTIGTADENDRFIHAIRNACLTCQEP
ncbi:MAG: aminotransferase class I/II-fold pyridoxal phosphate-dependent enzyme [Pararhodobacter sp.]